MTKSRGGVVGVLDRWFRLWRLKVKANDPKRLVRCLSDGCTQEFAYEDVDAHSRILHGGLRVFFSDPAADAYERALEES